MASYSRVDKHETKKFVGFDTALTKSRIYHFDVHYTRNCIASIRGTVLGQVSHGGNNPLEKRKVALFPLKWRWATY